jgi:hypothetical protein
MLLELDSGVFATDDGATSRLIVRLIGYVMDFRHEWYPTPAQSVEAAQYCERHFPGMTNWSEFMRNASTASAWQASSKRPAVRVNSETLAPMTNDLGRPAVVIVENGRNDGSFLKAVFAAYDGTLAQAERLDWLHIDHAGGMGEQGPLADEQARRFSIICRVIVIKDNDKGLTVSTPDDDSEEWPPTQPHVHMWHRLEVENYLPDAVLMESRHPDALTMISYLRAMTAEQQRLIDMKHGLKKAIREDLFQDLHPDCRKAWHHGFAGTFPSPLVPESITLTTEDFRKLGNDVHEELSRLLARIRRLT